MEGAKEEKERAEKVEPPKEIQGEEGAERVEEE
jgi:hypothetical protein